MRKDISIGGVFVMLAVVGTMWLFTMGHTPYRQWVVFRDRHLFVLTSRSDGSSYQLGKRVAEVLATHLPSNMARVTRAPNMDRVGSLISTKQFDVALLSHKYAGAMLHGLPPFDEHGPVSLTTIFELGDYLLVCRSDFPARHAYLVAMTLSNHRAMLPLDIARKTQNADDPTIEVPIHPGVSAYLAGHPLPASEKEPGDP